MIELKSLELHPSGGAVSSYEISFQTNPGTRESTKVTLSLQVQTHGGATVLSGDFGKCIAASPEMAMDKLACWFDGFAKELRERKHTASIPIFGS